MKPGADKKVTSDNITERADNNGAEMLKTLLWLVLVSKEQIIRIQQVQNSEAFKRLNSKDQQRIRILSGNLIASYKDLELLFKAALQTIVGNEVNALISTYFREKALYKSFFNIKQTDTEAIRQLHADLHEVIQEHNFTESEQRELNNQANADLKKYMELTIVCNSTLLSNRMISAIKSCANWSDDNVVAFRRVIESGEFEDIISLAKVCEIHNAEQFAKLDLDLGIDKIIVNQTLGRLALFRGNLDKIYRDVTDHEIHVDKVVKNCLDAVGAMAVRSDQILKLHESKEYEEIKLEAIKKDNNCNITRDIKATAHGLNASGFNVIPQPNTSYSIVTPVTSYAEQRVIANLTASTSSIQATIPNSQVSNNSEMSRDMRQFVEKFAQEISKCTGYEIEIGNLASRPELALKIAEVAATSGVTVLFSKTDGTKAAVERYKKQSRQTGRRNAIR
jgi:hypothetical protein